MFDNQWIETFAAKVEPENRCEFTNFVATGQTSGTYYAHLHSCKTCQTALEEVVKEISKRDKILSQTLLCVTEIYCGEAGAGW